MTTTFIDPVYLATYGLLPLSNLLSYFLHPSNPLKPVFPKPTSNEILQDSGVYDYDDMVRKMSKMTGNQIILTEIPPTPTPTLPDQPPPPIQQTNLFTITYINRTSSNSYTILHQFYCSEGVIYACPRASNVLRSAVGRVASELGRIADTIAMRRDENDINEEIKEFKRREGATVQLGDDDVKRINAARDTKGKLLNKMRGRVMKEKEERESKRKRKEEGEERGEKSSNYS